jgi:sestrin 1/3
LMHAITLVCHIHALCTFVFGCGITPELDSPLGHTTAPVPRESKSRASSESTAAVPGNNRHDIISEVPENEESVKKTERILYLLEELDNVIQNENQEYREDDVVHRFQTLFEDNRKLFHNLSNNNASMNNNCGTRNNHSNVNTSHEAPFHTALIDKFILDMEFAYSSPDYTPPGKTSDAEVNDTSDNTTSDEGVEIFRTLDFNWEDDGVTVAEGCIPNMGSLFNERFTSIYDLTYCSLWGQYNVQTDSYRRAVWNYIHSLYLIRHDDYNYYGIETLLSSSIRHYLLRVTVAPHTVTQDHLDMEDMQLFTHGEKVHLNLLAMDARVQASLLYALRAIKKSRV